MDGDGDWAPTTELLRRSTSGGAVRYGLHTWDCYSVTQVTISLRQSRSFMRLVVRRQEVCSARFTSLKTERPCELDVWARNVPTDRRRRQLELRFLVDSGTAEVESVSSEQRDD